MHFALRAPFLFLAALVPLLVVRITSREFGARYGWQAGCFALLLPLAGTLGLLALPDAIDGAGDAAVRRCGRKTAA